jgi:hypothetical protein
VFEAELSEIDSANAPIVGRSLIPNFIAINSNSPAAKKAAILQRIAY